MVRCHQGEESLRGTGLVAISKTVHGESREVVVVVVVVVVERVGCHVL